MLIALVRTLTVMLCDDAPELRALTRYGLEQDPGISVTGEAGEAKECFAIVRETRPDAVLLDLAMPGMDGLEAIPELRSLDAEMAIVVFSGFDTEAMSERAIECGADRYVQKGTNLAGVRTILYEAVAERRGIPAPSPSERNAVEEQLRGTGTDLESRAAALQRSNVDLEQFAYVASHELSEPLRIVSGFMELLRDRYGERLDEEGRAFIEHAMSGTERMQQLIDDLLAYSRLAGMELTRQEVSSADLVNRLVAELKASTEVDAEVSVGELPVLSAEPLLLERVFQNLLSNAIKFGGDAPMVEISAERVDEAWRFDLRDNGPGVAESDREKIFQMFQRLHGRDVPGTGIGLAICRRGVERHGGRIWCEPAPSGGTIFSFTIPDAL